MSLMSVLPGFGTLVTEFEVEFVAADGVRTRVSVLDAARVSFEQVEPVRRFPSYRGQRYFPGLWWSSTVSGHVGYESWLERDHLMLLDFDPAVVGVAAQPFWLIWAGEDGQSRRHAPDYFARLFARLADGTAVVVDVRPADRIKPRDAAAFEAARRACELVGWRYWLVGVPQPVTVANVRWLAGYRHPRHHRADTASELCGVFAGTAPLMSGAETVGDPIAVLPVLFHLLWRHDLVADLGTPLHPGTLVNTRTAS
jgi:hypothetical protein